MLEHPVCSRLGQGEHVGDGHTHYVIHGVLVAVGQGQEVHLICGGQLAEGCHEVTL